MSEAIAIASDKTAQKGVKMDKCNVAIMIAALAFLLAAYAATKRG